MAVPKRKVSKSRRDSRSSNKGLKVKAITVCQTCNSPVLPHQVCKECGHYKGVKILKTKSDRMYSRAQTRKVNEEKRGLTVQPEAAPAAKE